MITIEYESIPRLKYENEFFGILNMKLCICNFIIMQSNNTELHARIVGQVPDETRCPHCTAKNSRLNRNIRLLRKGLPFNLKI